MALQLLAADGVTVIGGDATFKAQRVTMRPPEALGWYSIGAKSGLITGVAAAAPLFSLRNMGANPVIVRRVGLGFITATGFTAAQSVDFDLIAARAFTASDSGGTAVALSGSNGKHRTALATPTSLDMRIAATGALTAGTRTLDANALAMAAGFAGATAAGVTIAPAMGNLFSHDPEDYPLVLALNEGLLVRAVTAFGALGAGNLYINIEMAEALAF